MSRDTRVSCKRRTVKYRGCCRVCEWVPFFCFFVWPLLVLWTSSCAFSFVCVCVCVVALKKERCVNSHAAEDGEGLVETLNGMVSKSMCKLGLKKRRDATGVGFVTYS